MGLTNFHNKILALASKGEVGLKGNITMNSKSLDNYLILLT